MADPTDELADITYWLMGSLTGANMRDIGMVFPIMLIGCATLFALRWRINILTMGDDEAATMGVNARRTRIVVIIAATLFVKQHAFIDVLAGLFVGALGDIIVYVVIGKKRDRLMAEGKRLRYGSCQNADS